MHDAVEAREADGVLADVSAYIAAFAASFFYVGLRAAQQLNVVHRRYRNVIPTSMLMAIGDMVLVSLIVQKGVSWIFLPIGIGAGLGAMGAMWLHERGSA